MMFRFRNQVASISLGRRIFSIPTLALAEALGVPAHLINGPEEINPQWLEGKAKVGITSGASTPEVLVEGVIQALAPERVTLMGGGEEDVSFSLPQELR